MLYSVNERLGVCYLMDLCISHTIKAFDAKQDPVDESIDLVFHFDRWYPGFTSIKEHRQTGSVEKADFGINGD